MLEQKEPNNILENKFDYLRGLNNEQKKAVETVHGPLLVLAGAGTGKTKVLTTRLAHILNQNLAHPMEILTVTFTNKAANEMRKRAEKLTNFSSAGWWLGTFHSIGARILRNNPELADLKNQFTIIDTDDQLRLLKQILSASNIDEKIWPSRSLANIIQRWKDRGLNFDNADRYGLDFANGKGKELYKIYQERLKTLNAVDYGDLLLLNLNMFKTSADLLKKYQKRFKFILVDEYQDTNICQYLWLNLLAKLNKNICVVGDDDQSIYSWRGAEVGNILRFEKDFPKAHVSKLEKNYRSSGYILKAADKLISNNKKRLGKSLWTDIGEGELIDIVSTYNGEDESLSISDQIERLKNNNKNLSDIAILVRASFQTRSFEERFLKIGLPYKIIGGTRFYERLEIKDALAYLRTVNNENDDLAFERIINTPRRNVGTKTIQTIQTYARLKTISLQEATRRLISSEEINIKSRIALRSLISYVDIWRKKNEDTSPSELSKIVLDESGYTEMWQKDKSPDSPSRLENLKELIGAISEFTTLGGFLEHIQLIIDNDSNSYIDSVNIMTLHAAKGLEFDYIFLPGWEEDIFPNRRSLDERNIDGLEEERRLAYVGITRAKLKIWIYYAHNRYIFGKWIYCSPSRFINELPEDSIRILHPNAENYSTFNKKDKISNYNYLPSVKKNKNNTFTQYDTYEDNKKIPA